MNTESTSESPRAPLDRIRGCGVLPVVTVDHAGEAAPVAEALLAGGLPCVEITFRTSAAPAAIAATAFTYPEMLVGAGTILSVEQANRAVEAGARFLVSPGYDDLVASWCASNDVPFLPGVLTPTEVSRALSQGIEWMKFFPAQAAGGIGLLVALSGVFGDVTFLPTGGIDASNLAEYLGVPAVAACGGSWLTSRRLIVDRDFEAIERLTAEAVAIVDAVRGRA